MKPVNSLCKELATDLCKDWEYFKRTVGKLPAYFTMLHICLLMAYILPENSLKTLLNIFNYIWTTGKFPEDWQYATIIPIPKPGKDPAEPYNYIPIALTSCLCKTLGRMINKRLTLIIIHRGSSLVSNLTAVQLII